MCRPLTLIGLVNRSTDCTWIFPAQNPAGEPAPELPAGSNSDRPLAVRSHSTVSLRSPQINCAGFSFRSMPSPARTSDSCWAPLPGGAVASRTWAGNTPGLGAGTVAQWDAKWAQSAAVISALVAAGSSPGAAPEQTAKAAMAATEVRQNPRVGTSARLDGMEASALRRKCEGAFARNLSVITQRLLREPSLSLRQFIP